MAALVCLSGRPLHVLLEDEQLVQDLYQLLAGVLPQLLLAAVLRSQQLSLLADRWLVDEWRFLIVLPHQNKQTGCTNRRFIFFLKLQRPSKT